MIEQHRFTAQHKGPMNPALYNTLCGLGAGAMESVCVVPASDSQAAGQGGCWRSRDF